MFSTIYDYCQFHLQSIPSDTQLQTATKNIFRDGKFQTISVLEDLKIIAHRGASGYAPENTLASVRKALEYPEIDIIEIDIHLSKDEKIMVIHDPDLQRTTDQRDEIKNLTFSEIRKADAGRWFDEKFVEEKVPTLLEILKLINGKKTLLIEIKSDKKGQLYDKIVSKTIAEIRNFNAEKWCIIQAFESEYLQETHQLAPEIEIQKLIEYPLSIPFWTKGYVDVNWQKGSPILNGVTAVNAYFPFWSASQIYQIQEQKLQTYVYTVNDTNSIKKMIRSGVDGIITNFPEKVIKLKDNLQTNKQT